MLTDALIDNTQVTLAEVPGTFLRPASEEDIRGVLADSARSLDLVPARFRGATVTEPGVTAWVRSVAAASRTARDYGAYPRIRVGRSLLLTGVTGSGKSHQAYGAIRAFAATGFRVRWEAISSADLYARLRPRHGVDPEEVFERYARAGLLLVDDLGAAKSSEWTEEINYRLVNYRYERDIPTIFTSNVPPKDLTSVLGERVASRLVEMADQVVIRSVDRRTAPGVSTT